MNDSNEFLELSSTETSFIASRSVLIGGSQRRVAKIMLYKQSWLQRNYFGPLGRLAGYTETSGLNLIQNKTNDSQLLR